MKKRNRIITGLLGIALAVGFLSGCAQSPEKVKLATAAQMENWCRKEYGPAEIVAHEAGKNSVTYTMRDIEKDFLYEAETYASTIWLDTVLGYNEAKRSDFTTQYMTLFRSEYEPAIQAIQRGYSTTFDFDSYMGFAKASGVELEFVIEACQELLELAAEYDTRDFWGDMEIRIYLGDEYGGLVRESTGHVPPEDEKAEWLMGVAAVEMQASVDKLEFVRMAVEPCESLPGYDPDKLMHILGSDNHEKTETDVCYFIYKNQEYWVADLCWQDDLSHTRHLGNFPSRYDNLKY